jgi:hypothetical protein
MVMQSPTVVKIEGPQTVFLVAPAILEALTARLNAFLDSSNIEAKDIYVKQAKILEKFGTKGLPKLRF